MKISVVGGGYVGIVTGTCFARLGHEVTIIEIDAAKAAAINNGQPPIYETGLEELMKAHAGKNLQASCSFASIASADCVFICVGTPPKPDGSSDLSFIASASASIGLSLKNTGSWCCVVVKSTVPPGTTEKIVIPAVLKQAGKTEDAIGVA